MRHDGWAELANDEEHGGCLIPMMMLYHEHDEDPEMRPGPISLEKREEIIAHMAAMPPYFSDVFRPLIGWYQGCDLTPKHSCGPLR